MTKMDSSKEFETVLDKEISYEMGKARLIDESGYPGDAEERAAFKEGCEEYRRMTIKCILAAHTRAVAEAEVALLERFMSSSTYEWVQVELRQRGKYVEEVE